MAKTNADNQGRLGVAAAAKHKQHPLGPKAQPPREKAKPHVPPKRVPVLSKGGSADRAYHHGKRIVDTAAGLGLYKAGSRAVAKLESLAKRVYEHPIAAAEDGFVEAVETAPEWGPLLRETDSSVVGKMSSAPAAVARQFRAHQPYFKQTGFGDNTSLVLSHTEEVDGAVAGAATWVEQLRLQLNPGLANFLPFCSTMASQYQQYVCDELEFFWVPTVGTSVAGDVAFIPSYDPLLDPPTTEEEASSAMGFVETQVWSQGNICRFDARSAMGGMSRKFVRSVNRAGDRNKYDLGQFFLYTNNDPFANEVVGKLFCKYKFRFFVPELNENANFYSELVSFYHPVSPAGSGALTSATDYGVCGLYSALANATASVFVDNPLQIVASVAYPLGGWAAPAGSYRVCASYSAQDTSPESFRAVSVMKQGAVVIDWVDCLDSSTAGARTFSIKHDAIWVSDGTDATSLSITFTGTGAAGTIKLFYCSQSFQLV